MLHTFVANAREEHDSFSWPPFYFLCGSLLIQRSLASQVLANTTALEISLPENTVCTLYVHDEVSEPSMLDRKVNNGFANVDTV